MHWRYSVAAEHTPPGFLVGGPNSTKQGGDPALCEVWDRPQLLRYVDVGNNRGFAVNEITITWNADLVLFTAYLLHMFR